MKLYIKEELVEFAQKMEGSQSMNHAVRKETLIHNKSFSAILKVWHNSPANQFGYNAIIGEYVDSSHSPMQKVERVLLRKAIELFGNDSLLSQFQNEKFIKEAYSLGFRNSDANDLAATLKLFKENSSVCMVYIKKSKGKKK